MSMLFKENTEEVLRLRTIVTGKWNGKSYNLLKPLGKGQNGIVYLVEKNNQYYALKISTITIDMMYEIQAVQRLIEARGNTLGFSIFDIDDFEYKGKFYSYYVMTYHAGISVKEYLHGKGPDEYIAIFREIIDLLNELHKVGFVFGDLKPEHIIVSTSKNISLVDFGGVTLIGESVRQYTEVYDRGAWKAGGRRADIHYDYFSLVMVFVSIAVSEKKLSKLFNQTRSISAVYDIIRNIVTIQPLLRLFWGILTRKVSNYKNLLEELELIKKNEFKPPANKWIDFVFASSLLLFISIFTLFLITY